MLFSSVTFLYYFLPAVVIVYFLLPRGMKNPWLLLTSLVFYGWGEPKLLTLMILTIGVFYGCGLAIGKAKTEKWKKFWMILSLAIGIGLLAVFKYADFFIQSFNAVTGLSLPLLKIALPVGISFYTFQCLSYTVDVYRGEAEPQRDPIAFGAYVTMFPQLIAGPIVRYADVAEMLQTRRENLPQFASGVQRFIIGLAKKVLLANPMGNLWNLLEATQGTLAAWMGILAYSLQIYFDFSGYSDMAIGLGRMFGFEFLENFNYPYISASITEFWRRWHISLSTWFKEYVYIPLGGNRKGLPRQICNIAIVWLLTGLWHGASWNFVLWGGYYALLLIAEKTFLLKKLEGLPRWLRHAYAMLAVVLGWALFYFENLGALGAFLVRLFRPVSSAGVAHLLLGYLPMTMVACLAATPLGSRLSCKAGQGAAARYGRLLGCGLLLLLCVAALVSQSYNPFIYFRF